MTYESLTEININEIANYFGYKDDGLSLSNLLDIFKKHLIEDGGLLREAMFDLEVLNWDLASGLGKDVNYYFQNKNVIIKFLIDVSRSRYYREYKVEITNVFMGIRMEDCSEWNFYELDTLNKNTTFKTLLKEEENKFYEL